MNDQVGAGRVVYVGLKLCARLLVRAPNALVGHRARQITADEILVSQLGQISAACGGATAYAAPALPAALGERIYVDADETGAQDHFEDRGAEGRGGEAGKDSDAPLPAFVERAPGHTPRGHDDERDDR